MNISKGLKSLRHMFQHSQSQDALMEQMYEKQTWMQQSTMFNKLMAYTDVK